MNGYRCASVKHYLQNRWKAGFSQWIIVCSPFIEHKTYIKPKVNLTQDNLSLEIQKTVGIFLFKFFCVYYK